MSMYAVLKTGLILATLFFAVPACGSNSSESSDALVGEWTGKCAATKDQDGSRVSGDSKVDLRFGQDGKYSQSIEGPDGGQLEGTYTASDRNVKIEAEGESINSDYSIKDDVLTFKTKTEADGTPVTSTCTMTRGSEG